MHERIKEHDRGIRLSRAQAELKRRPFLNTQIIPVIIRSRTKLS